MKPRLNETRKRLSLETPNLDSLLTEYEAWVSYPEWLIFQGETLYYHDNGDVEPIVKYKAAMASKRGNKVYNWRVKKRLKILDQIKRKPFTLAYFSRSTNLKQTHSLFVTLTYSRDLSLGDAWERVGLDLNRWLSGLKRKFGKFQFIRSFEAQKDGFPHIHILLIFYGAEFKVFRYKRKWRINEKSEFEWEWGFVDVEACDSLKDGISYIAKYIGKIHLKGAKDYNNLTIAIVWFYKKRSWSVSRAIGDLIKTMHNSNKISSDMGDGFVWTWKLLGFWGGYPVQLGLDDYIEGDSDPSLGWSWELPSRVFCTIYGSETWSDFMGRPRVDMDDRVGVWF